MSTPYDGIIVVFPGEAFMIQPGEVLHLDVRAVGSPVWTTISTRTCTGSSDEMYLFLSPTGWTVSDTSYGYNYSDPSYYGYAGSQVSNGHLKEFRLNAKVMVGNTGSASTYGNMARTFCSAGPATDFEFRVVNTTTSTTHTAVVPPVVSLCDPCEPTRKYGTCRVATTAQLSATYVYVGLNVYYDANETGKPAPETTLTASANGALVIDGVTLAVNDLVLVKDQTPAYQNCVYKVKTVGSASTKWVLSYPVVLNYGLWVDITAGTTNAGKKFSQTRYGPTNLPYSPQTFTAVECGSSLADVGGGGSTPPAGSTIKIYDEGVYKGTVSELDFIGLPVLATVTGERGSVAVDRTSGIQIKKDGSDLDIVSSLDFTGTGFEISTSGDTGTFNGTSLTWKGDWSDSFAYKKNDVVRNVFDDNPYVALSNHTSQGTNEPGAGELWTTYWDCITYGTGTGSGSVTPEQKTFLEDLKDSVFDWMDKATIGDWLTALAIGAGVIWAGSKIMDMMTDDGSDNGSGQSADSRYNGTPGYNGAFTAPSLQAVVSSLMTFGGYTAGQFDVTLLPAKEVHFTIGSTMTVRDVLANLSTVYQFDIVPSGAMVKFIPKYLASVRTLTAEDMGHQRAESTMVGTANYTAKRYQGIDLPRSVTLNYYSSALDHNVFTQVSTLETYVSGQDIKLEVPFTLDDAEAKRITETALVNAHIEQQQYTFVTDYYNIDLEPGDIITIPLDSGVSTAVRIIQMNETDDGLLEFTVVRSDFATSAYTASPVIPTQTPAQTTNTVASIGYSQSLFLEVPPLNDTETSPRMLVAVHGYGAEGWPGASLYRSTDSGTTYSLVTTSNKSPTFGMVATTIAAPTDFNVWDTTTTISVQLKQGTLSNSTDIAVQNGANWCMIGEEVVAFVNATLTGDKTYTLSRLLRGRLGTEVKCATHVNNELFVVLDNQLTQINLDQADVGKLVKYKTVTMGSDISKVAADDVQPFGLNMRPYRVAQPKLTKETNGDWTVTWLERPRYNNGLRDYTEIDHDADWGGYAIAFMDGASVVKKSLTTVSTKYTYTVAQQVTDFGSAQSTMKASIIQMSKVSGGGYPYVINA